MGLTLHPLRVGLAEYSCFLAAVSGLLLMRRREAVAAAVGETTAPRYRTWIGNPMIFTSVSAFLVLEAVVTDGLQGLALVSVAASGVLAYCVRFGWRGLLGASSADG